MTKLYQNGLFIFRRDFRITDNNGLNLANSLCKYIYPIFIFTPEQVTKKNDFKSNNAIQFMIESLTDLDKYIQKMNGKLYIFYGDNNTIIKKLIKDLSIDCVCFNADYSPYAIERDINIVRLCEEMNIAYDFTNDYYLYEPGTILSGSNEPYQKFTPFYLTCLKHKVQTPSKLHKINFVSSSKNLDNKITLDEAMKRFTQSNENILVHGGREEGLKMLKSAFKSQKKYSSTRNDLSKNTSLLSAYIKFGCVSIREVYKFFKSNKDFIRQLIWREFYIHILFNFPHVLGSAMKPSYNKIKWHHNSNWLKKWCDGETGFPVVDACMRQMNTSGWMHNRGRLIVSSFLVKTLLISWEEGEKYFAKKLTDYDPASNNGNWQWSASSGADSQPYFRIFNPWRQGEEHDSDCKYIKQWVPELKDVTNKDIHNWATEWVNYKDVKYPKPICNFEDQREEALKMYKDVFK
jgi:deoxyribodipyrimidine photo-lyase